MLTPEQREILEAEYLRRLARADTKVWKARATGMDACGMEDAPPMSYERAKMIGSMKRLHLKGFQKPK